MALTILQEPTSPNVSSTNLIYTVSSSNVPQFQFRYIADLYESGSSTKLARFKYPQNSSGTANIDMGRPIGDYLETNYNWLIEAVEFSNTTCKRFRVEFGEEYGTSYNSAVTTFTNEASASISVLKGNIQYPAISEWDTVNYAPIQATSSINWEASAYGAYDPIVLQPNPATWSDRNLSNNPNLLTMPATSKYYIDGSQYNWPSAGGVLYPSFADYTTNGYIVAQPTSLEDYATNHYYYAKENHGTGSFVQTVAVYDDSNNQIFNCNVTGSLPNVSTTDPTIISVPVGLGNLTNCVSAQPGNPKLSEVISGSAQWNYYVLYDISFPSDKYQTLPKYYYNEDKGADYLLSTGGLANPQSWAPGKYYPTNCKGEKTRFAFVNSFGVWDYYNVYMPTRRVTNIDRKTYEQDRINLNDRIATYNVSNRGETQYYTEYTDQFEITTDIIDSQESQWLREMFSSSEVYIQSGSDFIPINILNNRETIINTTARNKNYQYTIRYQFSNLREPR